MPDISKDDRLLNRKEAAHYLQERGCAVSYGHLVNLGAKGNAKKGPSFYKDGQQRAVYSVVDLELWRRNRLRRIE